MKIACKMLLSFNGKKKKKINRKSIYIFIEVIDCFMLITLYSYF